MKQQPAAAEAADAATGDAAPGFRFIFRPYNFFEWGKKFFNMAE